jgi:outer membrane protein assembly factor BamB
VNKPAETLYIGIGGYLVAIAASSGEELWRSKLKGSSYVTISVHPKAVYAGAAGELFCIDPSSGQIRWQNKLPGLGRGVIAFGDASSISVAAAAVDDAAAAAAGASSY